MVDYVLLAYMRRLGVFGILKGIATDIKLGRFREIHRL